MILVLDMVSNTKGMILVASNGQQDSIGLGEWIYTLPFQEMYGQPILGNYFLALGISLSYGEEEVTLRKVPKLFRFTFLSLKEGISLESFSGVCFTMHDGLSNQAVDHRSMLFVHSRMVRHPVGWSIGVSETAPRPILTYPFVSGYRLLRSKLSIWIGVVWILYAPVSLRC